MRDTVRREPVGNVGVFDGGAWRMPEHPFGEGGSSGPTGVLPVAVSGPAGRACTKTALASGSSPEG